MADPKSSHCVAVIGGATAGAEVADRLASQGVTVVVFEQNPRPFGKIEDGLPRWHVALRRKEYDTITRKLGQDGVHYVPNTQIGRDIDFADLAEAWGFSAVILANGAWRDRSLPVEGAEAYLDKGLIYQNPFIIAFNHEDEPGYNGQRFEYPDGAIVVGGGLASIDVAKVFMLEVARARLAERGIDVAIEELEVKGIPKFLSTHDLEYEDLGIEGCTIFYRRNIDDMPLAEIPEGADEARAAKVRQSRRRLLDKAMNKFRFRMEPLSAPDGLVTEGEQLVGLRFRRTRIEAGRVVMQDETFERRGSCVVSSIGSIPDPIPGIAMKGELFDFSDWESGRLDAYPAVFSVGNVVTGKGNIVASRKHAKKVSSEAIEKFLGLGDDHEGEEELLEERDASLGEAAERVLREVEQQPPLAAETLERILGRVRARQDVVGYGDDLTTWISDPMQARDR